MDKLFRFEFTPRIVLLLQQLEANRQIFKRQEIPESLRIRLQNQAYLDRAHFSSNGENLYHYHNPGEQDINYKKSNPEVLIRVYKYLEDNLIIKNDITPKDLLKLYQHIIRVSGTSVNNKANFRRFEESGIGSNRLITFIARPDDIPSFIHELLYEINGGNHLFPPVMASIVFLVLVKIAPFPDYNIFTAQILYWFILTKYGYDFRGLVCPEKYWDTDKLRYFIEHENTRDIIPAFLEYMLDSHTRSAREIISQTESEFSTTDDVLLPRQAEILALIRRKNTVSLKDLQVKFADIGERTIRYHLSQLQKIGRIIKRGQTRGAVYEQNLRKYDYLKS